MGIQHALLLLHFIGFATLFSTILAGWMLQSQYRHAADYTTKITILKSLRPIALLSPVAIVIMLITGVGNMHYRGLALFTEGWLSTKIVLFIIVAVNGFVFGARSGKRSKLIAQLAAGSAPQGATSEVARLDKQMRIFYIVQLLLLLAILTLSIVKPGRYGMV